MGEWVSRGLTAEHAENAEIKSYHFSANSALSAVKYFCRLRNEDSGLQNTDVGLPAAPKRKRGEQI